MLSKDSDICVHEIGYVCSSCFECGRRVSCKVFSKARVVACSRCFKYSSKLCKVGKELLCHGCRFPYSR